MPHNWTVLSPITQVIASETWVTLPDMISAEAIANRFGSERPSPLPSIGSPPCSAEAPTVCAGAPDCATGPGCVPVAPGCAACGTDALGAVVAVDAASEAVAGATVWGDAPFSPPDNSP